MAIDLLFQYLKSSFPFLFGGLILLWCPDWFLLVFGYMALRIVQSQFHTAPLLSIGEADFYLADLFFLGVLMKIILKAPFDRNITHRIRSSLLPGFVVFLFVMGGTVFVAWLRFGDRILMWELIPYLRFLGLQAGMLILLVAILRKPQDFERVKKMIIWVGYIAAFSIIIAAVLGVFGIRIGEVNQSAKYVRYQGFLGDSVKLFLLPFIFYAILSQKYRQALVFLIALLFTGGRYGVIGVFLGMVVIAVIEQDKVLKNRYFMGFLLLLILIILGLWFNIGGISTRFLNPKELNYGILKRVNTWIVAWRMLLDSPLLGFGFSSYRIFVGQYFYGFYPPYTPFVTETFSQVLKAAVDGGIPGIIAFFWMMGNFMGILHRAISQTEDDLQIFLKSGYVFAFTLLLMSPVVAWFLPDSTVSLLLMMFVGLAIRVSKRTSIDHQPLIPIEQVRSFAKIG